MKLREALRVVRDEQATASVRIYLHCLAVLDAAVEAHEARAAFPYQASLYFVAFDKLRSLELVTREEAGRG